MADKKHDTQKDAGLAEQQRPRPSQAEGEDDQENSSGSRPVPSKAEGEDTK